MTIKYEKLLELYDYFASRRYTSTCQRGHWQSTFVTFALLAVDDPMTTHAILKYLFLKQGVNKS